ncbi:MAG: hypothetical protein V4490_04355, partial [Pseudomonadota bacterium]
IAYNAQLEGNDVVVYGWDPTFYQKILDRLQMPSVQYGGAAEHFGPTTLRFLQAAADPRLIELSSSPSDTEHKQSASNVQNTQNVPGPTKPIVPTAVTVTTVPSEPVGKKATNTPPVTAQESAEQLTWMKQLIQKLLPQNSSGTRSIIGVFGVFMLTVTMVLPLMWLTEKIGRAISRLFTGHGKTGVVPKNNASSEPPVTAAFETKALVNGQSNDGATLLANKARVTDKPDGLGKIRP